MEKLGRQLYQEALAICEHQVDLHEAYDPATGMGPRAFSIWSLLQNLFAANDERDLGVEAKPDLAPYVHWYRRASEFECSEVRQLFK